MTDRLDRANTISEKELLDAKAELVRADREIRKATAALAAMRGVKAGVLKRAVALGANKQALLMQVQLEGMDPLEREQLVRDVGIYSAWSGVPLWTPWDEQKDQSEMFSEDELTAKAREDLDRARAHVEGWKAAAAGKERGENPHNAGEVMFVEWFNGWDYFQEEVLAAPHLAAAAKKASEEKRPRGRPKKSVVVAAQEETLADDAATAEAAETATVDPDAFGGEAASIH